MVFACQQQSSLVSEKKHFKGERCDEWRLSPQRFSSWTRLVRVHARVRRVIYNMKNPDNKLNGRELLPEEIQDAEEDVIRSAQCEVFNDEYRALLLRKPISKKSSLTKLSPRLDEQGVLRCDGLPYST